MGYYINKDSKGNTLSTKGKVDSLMQDGAVLAEKVEFQPNLVCVVSNSFFDAAGYVYSQSEFDAFNQPQDFRKKTWLIYEHAAELSGFVK